MADLHGTTTRALKQQVKRNINRFPGDFMFVLTNKESNELVTNCDRFALLKHSSVKPAVFTEQGVAMLSSILNSDRAISVNINIIRIFIRLRERLISHAGLVDKVNQVEHIIADHDHKILLIFEFLKQLEQAKQQEEEQENRKRIGFRKEDSDPPR